MNSLGIIISNPNINYLESQLLECHTIAKNIVVSFSTNNNIEENINIIIKKHNFNNVVITKYEYSDEIEYNPLTNKDPEVFWNNISRISGVSILDDKPDLILFLNGNEIPNNFVLSKYLKDTIKTNNKISYIFKNDIIILPSVEFKDELSIFKLLMTNNERLESANMFDSITETTNNIFYII